MTWNVHHVQTLGKPIVCKTITNQILLKYFHNSLVAFEIHFSFVYENLDRYLRPKFSLYLDATIYLHYTLKVSHKSLLGKTQKSKQASMQSFNLNDLCAALSTNDLNLDKCTQ